MYIVHLNTGFKVNQGKRLLFERPMFILGDMAVISDYAQYLWQYWSFFCAFAGNGLINRSSRDTPPNT